MKISWIPKFPLWWYLFILVIQLKIYWLDDMKIKSSIYIQVYVWITDGITNAVAMHPTCSTTWWLYSTNQVHDDFSLTRRFILRHGVGHMEFPVLWASLVSQVGASPYRVNLTAPVRLGQNCPRKLVVTMTMNWIVVLEIPDPAAKNWTTGFHFLFIMYGTRIFLFYARPQSPRSWPPCNLVGSLCRLHRQPRSDR